MIFEKKVVLTLGAGAALGYVHIGVLKYLEEQNIKISAIAGTSMGAILGGLYAFGLKSPALLELVKNLGIQKSAQIFFPTFPKGGMISTTALRKLLTDIVGTVLIENLRVPFRCVATDILTGEQVVFDKGPLIDAMIASMSIQGIFEPANLYGRYLSDGGLRNPVPWDIADGFGNRNIIVKIIPMRKSWIHEPSPLLVSNLQEKKINTGTIVNPISKIYPKPSKNSLSLIDVFIGWNNLTSGPFLRPRDTFFKRHLLLEPDLEGYHLYDFNKWRALVEIGYNSIKKNEKQLSRLGILQSSMKNPVQTIKG